MTHLATICGQFLTWKRQICFRPRIGRLLWVTLWGLWLPLVARADWSQHAWLEIVPPLQPSDIAVRIAHERAILLSHRGYLENRLQAAQPLLRLIGEEIEKRRLPAILMLLPLLESGYRLDVTSPKGAAGLWQLMPGTAMQYGVPLSASYDGRLALPQATKAALDYLTTLRDQFNGDWLLALAAYNCGENQVRSVQAQSQQTSYWALPLPDETRRYVPRLLALGELVQHAARYGLQLPAWESGATLVVNHMTGPIWLADLARRGHWPLSQLEALNPAFRRALLPAGMQYVLLLPRDQAKALAAQPAAPVIIKPGLNLTAVPPLVSLQALADPLVIAHAPPALAGTAAVPGLDQQAHAPLGSSASAGTATAPAVKPALDLRPQPLWTSAATAPLASSAAIPPLWTGKKK